MTDVDDKVVSMKFDNVAFERNLGETLRSLDKLRQSLDFANSTRGMNELSAAGKSFNLNSMSSSVDGVGAKFLALTTIGITALATLTTHAINAGARIVKAFSLAPVMDGFKEYETNINSIQTILANTDSKGTTLQDVNRALDELNQYADQTIYNFSEMTRNIGTFTAAGVDLKTSVASIKGIANVAAISGSNAEQASTAMYQLSQAMASGTVKLMDWNSVVNAGMGGEVFQKALFEAGKAAHTLTNVPVGQTFEQWKAAGNTFRLSLESGWLTTKVLTTALQGFTGDLTETQVRALGYTKEQAAEVMRLGKIGKAAATEVKTFTQLIGTVKEAVGSGWATSFRLIVGDFEEAKKLFTGISNSIGKVVGDSADARNKLLSGWKDLGGRNVFLQGLENSLTALGSILGPISGAFRDVFPPTTAKRLYELTQAFANFTAKLRVSSETSEKIRDIFRGVFSVLDIGKTIIKELLIFVGGLLGHLSGVGGGALSLAQKLGILLQVLDNFLVDGGGIHSFFVRLGEVIRKPIDFIGQLTAVIVSFFRGFSENKQVAEGLDQLETRFDSFSNVAQRFGEAFKSISKVLDGVFGYMKTWFSELGAKLAEAFQPGDFNAAVDLVNVGLLGGIVLMLKKFMKNGFKFDFGGGILDKVRSSLDGLTGTLKAMQANVRADTLMKIAIAVGVLTASIVVLSLINSADLTKAMAAMSVGFAQMVGVMALLDKVASGAGSAVKIGILAGGLILLAGAMITLSIAVKILSTMSWGELTKGLTGIAVSLGIMIAAMHLLPPPSGMIASGIAMTAIAIALILLGKAVKSFSGLSWAEMAKGLVGVAGGLVIIAGAMWIMPPGMVAIGLGLIALSTGLLILAKAVEAFSGMSWGEMGKGLLGIGAALVIIAGAMSLMPPGMILTSVGLLALSVALNIMAQAVQALGGMKLGDIVKGLGALAAMLGILAAAMVVMTGTLAGAAALLVVSGALVVLAGVLKILGGMSISQIATGLGAIAATFLVLGIAAALLTPVIPMLYSLGAALTLLGLGFSLFGAGAMFVAKAFEILAKAGRTGIGVLIDVIKMFIKALPGFVGAFVQSIAELAAEILNAAPLLLRLITALLLQILETVITLVPKIGEALGAIITTGLKIIREHFQEVLETGFLVLMELLRGIRDNIGEITTMGVSIIVNFVMALINNAQKLVDAGIALLAAFLGAIATRMGDVVTAGLNILINLILGIANNIFKVVDIVTLIVTTFVSEVSKNASKIVTAGTDALIKFVSGIINNLIKVSNAATDLVIAFISGIDDNALKIVNAAADMIINFLNGLAVIIREKSPQFREAGANIAKAIGGGLADGLKSIPVIGEAIKVGGALLGGLKDVFDSHSPSREAFKIAKSIPQGIALALNRDRTAENSAVKQAERIIEAFQATLSQTPESILGMGELNPVITPVLDLTRIQAASRNLDGLLSVSTITPNVSLSQARLISTTTDLEATTGPDETPSVPSEVKFEQNIYSPTQLSTNDIYRNTKSQIVLAKEELNI